VSDRSEKILRPRHPRIFFTAVACVALALAYSPPVARAAGWSSPSRVADASPSPTPSAGSTNNGALMICVAGSGAALGRQYAFTVGAWSGSVPAGPAPGGYCIVGPSLPAGSIATIQQTTSPYNAVSTIAVAPIGQLVSTADLASGTAKVTIGSGATSVTYTDYATTGYVAVCANPYRPFTGTLAFTVNPGNLGPFTVPYGACSPPITVTAGSVVIASFTSICGIYGSTTIPASRQILSNSVSSIVTVVPGDISTQTIVTINSATPCM